MLRGSNNMVFRVRVGSKDLKRYKGTLPRLCRNVRNNQTRPGMCWQEVKDVIDDITNHRGARMVFLTMKFNCHLNGSQNVDADHDAFVERLYEDAIEERRHQATRRMKRKAIGTTNTTQARNQASCSR